MIVAYHKGYIAYAYNGIFNYNIDHDWTGGIINNFTKIIDDCTSSQWRIQDFEKGGSTPTQMHSQALPA